MFSGKKEFDKWKESLNEDQQIKLDNIYVQINSDNIYVKKKIKPPRTYQQAAKWFLDLDADQQCFLEAIYKEKYRAYFIAQHQQALPKSVVDAAVEKFLNSAYFYYRITISKAKNQFDFSDVNPEEEEGNEEAIFKEEAVFSSAVWTLADVGKSGVFIIGSIFGGYALRQLFDSVACYQENRKLFYSTFKIFSIGAGAWQGAGLGALLGTMVCPGLGTVIGSMAGGLIGSSAGVLALKGVYKLSYKALVAGRRYFGNKRTTKYKYAISPESTKKLINNFNTLIPSNGSQKIIPLCNPQIMMIKMKILKKNNKQKAKCWQVSVGVFAEEHRRKNQLYNTVIKELREGTFTAFSEEKASSGLYWDVGQKKWKIK